MHFLVELAGATVRQVKLIGGSQSLFEFDLDFRSHQIGEATRLILGGLDGAAFPVAFPEHHDRGWQAPFGIGNLKLFESYE